MVKPTANDEIYNDVNGPIVSQAGLTNFNYGYTNQAYGNIPNTLKYWVND